MVFNAVFILFYVISRQAVYLPMLTHAFLKFFQPVLRTTGFQSLLIHITTVETMDSSEKGMNPILGKNIGRAGVSNQRPPVLKSCKE